MAEKMYNESLSEQSVPAKKARLNDTANATDDPIDEIKEASNLQTALETTGDNEQMAALRYNSSTESDDSSVSESTDDEQYTSGTTDETVIHASQMRKFKQIPVFIVEYHNDVQNFIFHCIRSRFMPCAGNTLIHFDSHPDMVIPRELPAQLAYEREELLNECSIESWIMPMCYTGIITRIVWIKHPCCKQIPLGKHTFHIGSYNDKIYVDLAIPYFLSEASLCTTSQLVNARAIELLVVNDFELDDAETEQTPPLDWFSKENEPYILDIDLDFFCTKNPFLNLYNKCDYYEDLAQIFALDTEVLNDLNTNKLNERRLKTVDALKSAFEHLAKNAGQLVDYQMDSSALDAHKFALLQKLVDKLLVHYKPQEIDWLQIFDAGCTSDSGGLPCFTATTEDLEAAGQRFRQHLEKLPHEPLIVTISRSSEDEFCPSAQVEEIQALALRELGSKLKLHKPIRGDKDEDYNIMKL